MSNYYNIIADVAAERKYQNAKWGGPQHDDRMPKVDWLKLFQERVDSIKKAAKDGDDEEYRKQLIKLAASVVASTESFDRKGY